MKAFVDFIRWIFVSIFTILLIIVTILAIVLSAVSTTITDRKNPKNWLIASGVYNNAKNIAIEFMLNVPKENSDSSITMNNEPTFFMQMGIRLKNTNDDFTKLVDKIAKPKFLENSVNTIIDAFYDWAEGKTDKPTFSIKIVENQSDFVEFLSITFREKAKSLPTCEPGYKIPSNFEPLSTQCWPKGMDFNEVNKFIEANSGREEFKTLYSKATFSSELLTITPEVTSRVQLVFKVIQFMPLITFGILLLLCGIILLLSPTKSTGFIVTGIAILTPVIAWNVVLFSNIIDTSFLLSSLPPNARTVQFEILLPHIKLVIENILRDITNSLIISIIVTAAMGIAMFVCAYISRKRATSNLSTKEN